MTTRPKILDLFSGAGGAGYGLYLAGFDVTGIDIRPQPNYPQNDAMRFVQADAIEYALAYGWQFDAIWASPPCQTHSQITPDKSKHLDLIPQSRFVLESLGLPYIIENVYGAKKALRNPVMLCGASFGLKVYRHRLFESNVLLLVPSHKPHRDSVPSAGHLKNGSSTSPKGFISIAGHFTNVAYGRVATQINWMGQHELAQSIPPAYSDYLGKQLIRYVLARKAQS